MDSETNDIIANSFREAIILGKGDLDKLKSLEKSFPGAFDAVKESLAELAYTHRRADILIHLVLEKGLDVSPHFEEVQYDDDLYGKGADQFAKTIECVTHAAFDFSTLLRSEKMDEPAKRSGSCYNMYHITDAMLDGGDFQKARELVAAHPINPYFVQMVIEGKWHEFAERMLARKEGEPFRRGKKHFIHVLESAEHVKDLGNKLAELTNYVADTSQERRSEAIGRGYK